ncbi:hypothetical protein PPL_01709 [Heterostelium album PN500]|uniref:Uncharacterized protein n=1 Tax=Heterostelium pallidum (strain ATCC 26659 / Pp 5 / PN500) TaxID=670386 RepID=D3B093_HETP5|nr:hypothetical protein PPL_01709 [Heterostelium album PN500]EFA84717.1 hypothetical protein PPL_01709 [Heterostelium album PN500]|eukprot:XP_020436829.1 hypothetical protein PPL_01709 [Heterostelium album PN500]
MSVLFHTESNRNSLFVFVCFINIVILGSILTSVSTPWFWIKTDILNDSGLINLEIENFYDVYKVYNKYDTVNDEKHITSPGNINSVFIAIGVFQYAGLISFLVSVQYRQQRQQQDHQLLEKLLPSESTTTTSTTIQS